VRLCRPVESGGVSSRCAVQPGRHAGVRGRAGASRDAHSHLVRAGPPGCCSAPAARTARPGTGRPARARRRPSSRGRATASSRFCTTGCGPPRSRAPLLLSALNQRACGDPVRRAASLPCLEHVISHRLCRWRACPGRSYRWMGALGFRFSACRAVGRGRARTFTARVLVRSRAPCERQPPRTLLLAPGARSVCPARSPSVSRTARMSKLPHM